MITAAKYIVIAQTLFFAGLTVAVIANPTEISPTSAYAVITLQFGGFCVIASWRRIRRRK